MKPSLTNGGGTFSVLYCLVLSTSIVSGQDRFRLRLSKHRSSATASQFLKEDSETADASRFEEKPGAWNTNLGNGQDSRIDNIVPTKHEGLATNVDNEANVEWTPSLLEEDSMFWNRLLTESMSLSMSMPQSCVPENVDAFVPQDDVDIGDVLDTQDGFLKSCGDDCYQVQDNGDDPPFDPQNGDTLRFAYKSVSSNQFYFRSRVCGVDCGTVFDPDDLFCGRVGLAVRESLDPKAKNLFVSHFPLSEARWTYRKETMGASLTDFNGSVDVECIWITLIRNGDDFSFTFNNEDDESCLECDDTCVNSCVDGCNCQVPGEVTIPDMPANVLVGLAVSTPVSGAFGGPDLDLREKTIGEFRDIEFRDGFLGNCPALTSPSGTNGFSFGGMGGPSGVQGAPVVGQADSRSGGLGRSKGKKEGKKAGKKTGTKKSKKQKRT